MSASVQQPLNRSRPWKHAVRVFFEGGTAFVIAYIAMAYASGAHLDVYPSLNPREKILHCAAEAVLLGIPVFGVTAFLVWRMEDRVHDKFAGLSLPFLYGAAMLTGGAVGLLVGLLFSLTSFIGVAMASSLPAPAACGGGAGLLSALGKRARPRTMFRIFEWAFILAVCGLVIWLKGALQQ